MIEKYQYKINKKTSKFFLKVFKIKKQTSIAYKHRTG
jgi:hypothetical protein